MTNFPATHLKESMMTLDDGRLVKFQPHISAHAFTTLRENYKRHHVTITNTSDLKACIRAGEHTSIGGYRLAFITKDNGVLSFEAVKECWYEIIDAMRHNDDDQWHIVAMFNIDETGSVIYCDHTGKQLS